MYLFLYILQSISLYGIRTKSAYRIFRQSGKQKLVLMTEKGSDHLMDSVGENSHNFESIFFTAGPIQNQTTYKHNNYMYFL